jgi:hypothetical protein
VKSKVKIKVANKAHAYLGELKASLRDFTIRAGALTGKEHPSGEALADVVMWNEFGTDKAPERPFIRPAFTENRDEYMKAAKYIMLKKVQKKAYRPLIQNLGANVVNDIQLKIRSNVPPENKKSTQDKKGHGNTLLDTEFMHDNMEFDVISKNFSTTGLSQ